MKRTSAIRCSIMGKSSQQFLEEHKGETMEMLTIRVPSALAIEARRLAKAQQVSLTAFCRAGIEKITYDFSPHKPKQETFPWK